MAGRRPFSLLICLVPAVGQQHSSFDTRVDLEDKDAVKDFVVEPSQE